MVECLILKRMAVIEIVCMSLGIVLTVLTVLTTIYIIHKRDYIFKLVTATKHIRKPSRPRIVIRYGVDASLAQTIVLQHPQSKNEMQSPYLDEMDITEEILYGHHTSRKPSASNSSNSSITSPYSSSDFSSLSTDVAFDHPRLSIPSDTSSLPEVVSPPRLTFSLATRKSSGISSTVNLSITVDSASDLPLRDYGVNCDPVVQISMFRNDKTSWVPAQIMRTQVARASQSPVYCFTTSVELESSEVKNFVVVFTVLDCDRYIGEDVLGYVTVCLADFRQALLRQERFTETEVLQHVMQEKGQILFGIKNVPTLEKISFRIIKVSNVSFGSDAGDLKLYVKIYQFDTKFRKGRLVRKKKTSLIEGTRNPWIDETIDFHLDGRQLEYTNFVLTVCDRTPEVEDEIGIGIIGEKSLKRKDVCVGRVVVGRSAKGEKEKDHWNMIIQMPNQMINHCHNLV